MVRPQQDNAIQKSTINQQQLSEALQFVQQAQQVQQQQNQRDSVSLIPLQLNRNQNAPNKSCEAESLRFQQEQQDHQSTTDPPHNMSINTSWEQQDPVYSKEQQRPQQQPQNSQPFRPLQKTTLGTSQSHQRYLADLLSTPVSQQQQQQQQQQQHKLQQQQQQNVQRSAIVSIVNTPSLQKESTLSLPLKTSQQENAQLNTPI